MNVSDLDCPQYVKFDSEDFQRGLKGQRINSQSIKKETSTMSVDSLDVSEQSGIADEQLPFISGDLSTSQLMENCESEDASKTQFAVHYNYMESRIDQENMKNFPNQKENFSIQQPQKLTVNIKSMVPKSTIPKPFQFETDSRVKSKPTRGLNHEKKEFSSELRQNVVLPHKKCVTKQQPFNLTEAKKRKRDADYLPLAEQIKAFHRKTPERYHTGSHKDFQPQEHWEPRHVKAKSPKLQALKRRRTVQALSKEQQEEKEIEEMKAYEFHARPVDPKIYNQPSNMKTQPEVKTKLTNFRLKTTRKAVMQLRNRKKSQKNYEFKARPVPTAILSGTTGLKEKQVIPVTEPKAPAFEIDNRLEKRKLHEQEKKVQEEQKELLKKKEALKRHPVSDSNVSFVPYTKKRTEIQPFSFDKSDKERFIQKEKKIQEEIEKESKPYIFQAQPMPFPEPSSLPSVQKKPITQPEPFNFLLDNKSLKQNNYLFEEKNISFKAQPATVLKKEPFVPEKPHRGSIEIKEFNLYTDKRASERQQLKEIKDVEDFQKQQALLMHKALEEERERLELIKHRREIVHKANPIRQFKTVEIKPSSLPLTQPKSPDFETEKRLKVKNDSGI